jgi:hypothetical protein
MTSGAQGAVERMIAAGAPFEDIEQYIDQLALPSEQLSALWLLAWAEATEPLTRRQIVAEVFAGYDGPPGSSPEVEPSAAARAPQKERRLVSIRRIRPSSRRGGWQRRGAR